MSYRFYNANPSKKLVGDCVIRAISKASGLSWKTVHMLTAIESNEENDIQNSNSVCGAVLRDLGFRKYPIPNTCPDCYTIRDFCYDHPYGTYVLATGSHVVAVEDGDYYDSWDSGDEVPIVYWRKED